MHTVNDHDHDQLGTHLFLALSICLDVIVKMNLYSTISCKVSQLRSKTPSLTAGSRSSTGSEFQTVGPPTEKVRRPSVLRRYRGTIMRCRLADRRCRWPECSILFSRHRRTMTASLYSTRSRTLSQCRVGRESALTDRSRTCSELDASICWRFTVADVH